MLMLLAVRAFARRVLIAGLLFRPHSAALLHGHRAADAFNPHDVPTLIANIATANGNGVDNTITLDAVDIYTLSAVDNGDPTAATANGLR